MGGDVIHYTRFDLDARAKPISIPLYAALRPRRWPWWRRLLRQDPPEHDARLGHLEVDREALHLRSGGASLSIVLEEPFTMNLAWWPYEDATTGELTLTLVGEDKVTAIRLKTVWLAEEVDAHVARKRSEAPFLTPESFARLWQTLAWYAAAHGREVPGGLELGAPPERLEGLASQGEISACVSCGSYRVTMLGPEAYRCLSCGYEGGAGLERHTEARRRAVLAREPELEREQTVRRDLFEVQRVLKGATLAVNRNSASLNSRVSHQTEDLLSVRRLLRDACYRSPWVDAALAPILDAREQVWAQQQDQAWEATAHHQAEEIALLSQAIVDLMVGAGIHEAFDEVDCDKPIPDNDPAGIRSTLNFARAGWVVEVMLVVRIVHPYRGDLQIALTHADARLCVFDGRDSGRDLFRTFVLTDFNGLEVAGDWTLEVADTSSGGVGRLMGWSLVVKALT